MHVQIVEGDLLDQQVDAIVNTWNRNIIPWFLLLPQGVSGTIKKRGGYKPFIELGKMGPIPFGHAVYTSAGRLPYKYIIHVAGINMFWRATKKSIQDSVRNSVELAEKLGMNSLAFPIIGSGSGGYSQTEAEKIMIDTLSKMESDLDIVIVRFKKL